MSSACSAICKLSEGWISFLILSLLLAPAVALGQSKGHGVEVQAVSMPLLDTAPGRILSLSFRVTNHTSQTAEFSEALELPADWQTIIPPVGFRLAPAEAQVAIVAFLVPASAAAGDYTVTYTVRSRVDYGLQDAETVTVSVLPFSKLTILVEDSPDLVIAGQKYQVKLRLLNQGNAAVDLQLEAQSDREYPLSLDVSQVALNPGSSQLVILTIQTDKYERQARQHSVQVQAREAGSGELEAATVTTAKIIPLISQEPDLYQRLPAILSLRAVGAGGEAGQQLELRGAGALTETGEARLDFLLSGPDTQHAGLFGRRDEYRLNYSTPNLDLRLGDQCYGLSLLTENYHYGRGVAVGVNPAAGLGFGAYTLRTRWSQPQEDEVGAYLSTRLSGTNQVKFNWLHRARGAVGEEAAVDDSLWSLETRLKLNRHSSLIAEHARSSSDQASAERDDAYYIALNSIAPNRTHYTFSKLHAGPDYRGYYRDCDRTDGAVTLSLGKREQVSASFQQWQQNLELRADRLTAPQEKVFNLQVSRSYKSRWSISFGYQQFGRRDLLRPADFNYAEQALIISLGRASDKYNFRADLRGGTQRNLLTHQAGTAAQLSLFASCRPARRQTVTVYGSIGNTNAQGSRLLGFGNNLGVSTSWQQTERLFLNFNYLRYGFSSDNQRSTGQVDAELAYALPDETTWAFRIHRDRGWINEENELSYVLSYSIPLGIPVGRKRKVGAIKGYIYAEQMGGKRPIANAIVTTDGEAVATDRFGSFTFSSLKPGNYLLHIDASSLGPNQVTQDPRSQLVQITGGEVTQVDIPVIEAAGVSGVVAMAPAAFAPDESGVKPAVGPGEYVVGDPRASADSRQAGGLANLLVELTQEGEVLRRVTDQSGRFLFDGLRPGRWRLVIYDYNLPAMHYIENSARELELIPGEQKELSFQVRPRLRRIKMMEDDQPELLSARQ